MNTTIVLANSLLVVILILILIREHRLRRALESLLRRLINHWRNHEPNPTREPVDVPDRRMRK